VSAPAPLLRRAPAQPVKGSPAFDVILSGQRERTGLVVGPGQWVFPDRIPVTIYRGGAVQEVGAGRPFIDNKGNPRVRGMWSSTPLGEYVKTLVAQRVLRHADLELEASIDDAGARVYRVVSAVFTLPSDPPPSVPSATGADASLLADTAAELLGLAARIYAANQADVAALADRIIACAVALGGTSCSRAHHQVCGDATQSGHWSGE
jgi:hypothetical protein